LLSVEIKEVIIMTDLKTNYLGVPLKNPVVVGACKLTSNIDSLKKIENAGAAAVVLKSLFEEQIGYESYQMEEELTMYNERYAEMVTIHPDIKHGGASEHITFVKEAKNALNIPIIGSVNAVSEEIWIEYSKLIEEAGVDALELNFYHVPVDFDKTSEMIEREQIDLVSEICKNSAIPVSVKLSMSYSNPLNMIKRMKKAGVSGVVLYNRVFKPDINLKDEKNIYPIDFSSYSDIRNALRTIGLAYDKIDIDLIGSNGVFSGLDVAKSILVGADAVQVVSSLYKNGIDKIGEILNSLKKWMIEKGYNSLEDFRGKLSKSKNKDIFAFERAQYVDILMNIEKIFVKTEDIL